MLKKTDPAPRESSYPAPISIALKGAGDLCIELIEKTTFDREDKKSGRVSWPGCIRPIHLLKKGTVVVAL